MRRTVPAVAVLAAVLALSACGSDSRTDAPATASTAATVADPLGPDAPAPVGLSCAQIGGTFEAHGTDGRGTCVPADPRAHCHVPPVAQDEHYVPEFVLTPPFPTGTVARA
ncbi:hypothetical protein ACIA5H_37510, partial [Nocardia sp. NPDC051900]